MGIFKKETLGKRVRRLNIIPTGEKHLLSLRNCGLRKAKCVLGKWPDDT